MAAPVRVGDVLAEKYEVTRVLGQGGMGVVVAAKHRELDRLVALKFMHDEYAANELAIDRFLREARAAARLRNEHVAQVLDVGRLPSGAPYIVMEYLEGRDLGVIAETQRLSISDVCEYVLQACEAMAEAHAAGIVHRDLKPQNLMLTTRSDGRPLVKVLDFGISKAQFAAGPTVTQQAMGTPAYMSPEQMRSARSVDVRADIWSIGVILYQLLSNTLPWNGETVPETILKVMSDPTPSIRAIRPDVSTKLARVIEKCLEKDRERRYSNVAELAHDLMPFAPERARAAIAVIERAIASSVVTAAPRAQTDPAAHAATMAASVQQTTLGTAAGSSMTAPPRRTNPIVWVAPAIALATIAVIAVVATRHTASTTQPTPASTDAANAASTDAANAANADAANVASTIADAAIAAPDVALVEPDAAVTAIVVDAAVPRAACYASSCGTCSEHKRAPAGCTRKPEHACYRAAKCERQSNGECGWTRTQALAACLAKPAAVPVDAGTPPIDAEERLEPARVHEEPLKPAK